MEPVRLPVLEDFKQKRKKLIIVMIVAVAISTVAYAGTFSFSAKTVTLLTADMHINYTGSSSGYFGPSVQYLPANYETMYAGGHFSYAITLTNHGTSAHTVKSITLSTVGFGLISTSKSMPLTIQPGASQTIVLAIQLPNSNFSGNLDLTVSVS